MVPLPLFKLATLFVRHVSKYGANRIKAQAHDHPRVRTFAARYGQAIHQLNMRLQVAVLRDADDDARAREKAEKAEAPTVKTKERTEREEELRARASSSHKGQSSPSSSSSSTTNSKSVWRRKFRPLPEAKAVDLFADVVGDAFILAVAAVLIVYEYWRTSSKPDYNLEKICALEGQVEELQGRERELEERETQQRQRFESLEAALRELRDPKTKRPLLPTLQESNAAAG